MLRVFLIILGIGALIYLGVCAALFFFQRSLIYFPQPRAEDTPGGTIQLPVAEANLVVSVLPRALWWQRRGRIAESAVIRGGLPQPFTLLHALSRLRR